MIITKLFTLGTNLKKFLLKVSILVAIAAAIGTLSGFLGKLAWWLDLTSHFRVQYFIVFLILSLYYHFLRKKILTVISIVFIVINLCVIIPLFIPPPDLTQTSKNSYRVMLINVNTQLGLPQKVLNSIKKSDPDFIIIEEINSWWIKQLFSLKKKYPYRMVKERNDNFGIALFSKYSFVKSKIVYIGVADVPSVYGKFHLNGNPLTIIGTHPVPPTGRENSCYRNDQLTKLPEFIKQFQGPLLLLGDLNISPWSHYFYELLKDSKLLDSSKGRGMQPTWPTYFWPLLIPIDHCLHNNGITIQGKETGPDINSDHYPLIIDFSIIENLKN